MPALQLEDINYTYDEYRLWDGRWELWDGVPIAMSPAPLVRHQIMASEIIRHLGNQIDGCMQCQVLGEVDYKLSENTVLRPDVVLTCGETHELYLTKAPEIIVEIISKSTAKRDEVYKYELYRAEKVKYYIIVYPNDLVAKIYRLDGKEYDKQGDFSMQSYEFDDTTCDIKLDFADLFKRFRK